jgi:hypothetical protein
MVRAVLGLGSILIGVAIVLVCFGYTTPQITGEIPGINRAAEHAAGLMAHTTTLDDHAPPDSAGGAHPHVPATPPPSALPPEAPPVNLAPQGGSSGQEAEIISPDTTAHLNSDHVHEVEQPGQAGNAASGINPPGFVAPNPLPAHSHWTWDVQTREFTNVVVTHVDADLVTITSDSGPAQIDIGLLEADIQRELNYNPTLAAEAAAARRNVPAP